MPSAALMTCASLLMLVLAPGVRGHGSMYEPPSRGAMYHLGYDNPPDNNFWENNCGGREEQWDRNRGLCGVCGDPYVDKVPRDHENGGIFGNGLIGRYYHQGETIPASAYFSISHKGSFSFALCPLANTKLTASEECFQRYPLRLSSGESSVPLPNYFLSGYVNVSLVLPSDVTCRQCVLRWKYRAGNDWGCDASGECCVGCGKRQEEFYACADIAIYPRGYPLPSASPSTPRPTPGYPTRPPVTSPTPQPTRYPSFTRYPTVNPRPTTTTTPQATRYPSFTRYPTVTPRPTTTTTPQPTRYPSFTRYPTVTPRPPTTTPEYKEQAWAGVNSIVPEDSCPNVFCRYICRTPGYCPEICPAGCKKGYY